VLYLSYFVQIPEETTFLFFGGGFDVVVELTTRSVGAIKVGVEIGALFGSVVLMDV